MYQPHLQSNATATFNTAVEQAHLSGVGQSVSETIDHKRIKRELMPTDGANTIVEILIFKAISYATEGQKAVFTGKRLTKKKELKQLISSKTMSTMRKSIEKKIEDYQKTPILKYQNQIESLQKDEKIASNINKSNYLKL